MNKNRKTLKMPVRYLMNAVLVVLLFLALSYMTGNMLSTYQNKVLMTVGINIILAVSLNVATGYLGQLPLGHAGFMAVGAYTCALFTKYSPLPDGVSCAIGLALGAVMAGLFGVLIGVPALRLTGDYLAILTLGFGEIIRITLNNIDDVLGYSLFYGSKGLKNIPKYSNFANVFLCVVITCFLIHAMMKSRHGRAVLAIRDNEIAAESCGIQTTYYKVMAFAFSAAFAGLAQVPEGRHVFLHMTVEENLDMGAYTQPASTIAPNKEKVFELFPRLKERRKQLAGTMSGGEQQMLAMGRALMSNASMLMLDEPSMGLSPLLVQEIFDIIRDIHKEGMTILLVEQNAQMALSVADRAYVLETGRVVMDGTGAELLTNERVRNAYLGG